MIRAAWSLVCVLGAAAANAGVLTWSSSGPETGEVRVVRFAPSQPEVVYVGTRGGVFRSSDSGLTWVKVNEGLLNRDVGALAVDPSTATTVYVGASGNVWKSTNGGASWSQSGALFAGGAPITWIVIDPSNPSILYVSTTSQAVFPSLGVQKSINGGQSFSDAGANGLGTKNVYTLAIDPVNPSIVFAGGLWDNSDRPLFKTTNGGGSWISVSSGLSVLSVDVVAVDPLVSGTVLMSQAGNVRRSTNGGTSWAASGSGLSSSGAATSIVYERNSSTNLWYSSLNDVYRSTNGGLTWTAAKVGTNERVSGLDVSGAGVGMARTPTRGLYRRIAEATSWTPANSGFLASRILSMAADQTTAGVVYAGTQGTGLFKSTDHGRTWVLATSNFLLDSVNALVIDPRNSSTLYVAEFSGVYRSVNGGSTWSSGAFSSRCYSLAIDPLIGMIYAGCESGVRKSTDGISYTSISAGLPVFTPVQALAVDPTNTMTLYAGVDNQGVWKTTDGGANWVKKSTGLTNQDVTAIVADARNAGTLYAATFGGGVNKSTNGGESWSDSDSGITTQFLLSLLIDPADSTKIYAGAINGVYQSTNAGASWTLYGGLSPANSYAGLALEPGGNALHAGANGGVWTYQLRPFEPTIAFLNPREGSRIGNRSTLLMSIEDFTFDCAAGPSNQNRGIWRVDVDGVLDGTGCTTPIRLTRDYALGTHRVTVSLRNPDGSALATAAQSSVNLVIIDLPSKRRAVKR